MAGRGCRGRSAFSGRTGNAPPDPGPYGRGPTREARGLSQELRGCGLRLPIPELHLRGATSKVGAGGMEARGPSAGGSAPDEILRWAGASFSDLGPNLGVGLEGSVKCASKRTRRRLWQNTFRYRGRSDPRKGTGRIPNGSGPAQRPKALKLSRVRCGAAALRLLACTRSALLHRQPAPTLSPSEQWHSPQFW